MGYLFLVLQRLSSFVTILGGSYFFCSISQGSDTVHQPTVETYCINEGEYFYILAHAARMMKLNAYLAVECLSYSHSRPANLLLIKMETQVITNVKKQGYPSILLGRALTLINHVAVLFIWTA